jgi:hypothetical protein
MLNLPETWRTTQRWRSLGTELYDQAGKKKALYLQGEKRCERRLQSRIQPIYYIQDTFPVSLTGFELIKQKGSYAASSMHLNRTFSYQQWSSEQTRRLPKPLNVGNNKTKLSSPLNV